MIVRLLNCQMKLSADVDGSRILSFDDLVHHQDGSGRVVLTGLTVELGPMNEQALREMCQGILAELDGTPRVEVARVAPLPPRQALRRVQDRPQA